MKPVRATAAVIALAALLSACTLPYDLRPTPGSEEQPRPSEPARPATTTVSPDTVDHGREAARLLSLAESSRGQAAQSYRLRAAGELIRAGRLREAERQLATLDAAGQPASFRVRLGIYQAQVALYDGDPQAAMTRLGRLDPLPAVEPDVAAEWRWTRARTLLAVNRNVDAARELIERDKLLASNAAIARNHQELWEILESTDSAVLRNERSRTNDPTLRGWIDLALVGIAYAYDPRTLSQQSAAWRRGHPAHPAQSIATTLGAPAAASALDTSRVALLLPLTSRFADAANAVYRGFMAVHEASSDPARPLITLYDIGDDPAAAPLVYRQAVQGGATFVVGPLGLEAAQQVANSGVISVPTLLLAYVDDNALPARAFQFGLSPEDEARQVAQRAYLDGHRVAALLYPASPWGERVRSAFTEQWESFGGIVAEGQAYQASESDHSGVIKDLLNIEDSMRRHAHLESVLRTNLAFEPRRRQDVSFLFMAADAQQGRLLNPQINFYRALDLPVYATSSIFAGKPDPVYDADLNGITFGDMPWMVSTEERYNSLRAALQDEWTGQRTQLDRLFALGMDAYRIMPQLAQLRSDPIARISGVTGGITVDAQGRVHRQLTWARFDKGVPVVIEPSYALPGRRGTDHGTEAPIPIGNR
jgi:outer membrane PBP1 activator LpoA protein